MLGQEKELTRLRDRVAEQRRRLPWVRIDKEYRFDRPEGSASLPELFAGRSQLLVYHFMYGTDWEEGCPSCSFWADSFDGVGVHLAHRDMTFVAISRAPLPKLIAYQQRMGWTFPWYSSAGSDFNVDFGVSFTPEQNTGGAEYNYAYQEHPPEEAPGSAPSSPTALGAVFHAYSAYAAWPRSPEQPPYQLLDLVPKGRDEDQLPWSMAWLRRHDAYSD